MRFKTHALLLALALGAMAPGTAVAQQNAAMRVATDKDWTADAAAQTWLKRFAPKAPVRVAYQTYKIGAQSISVFVGLTDACDDGPNSIDSKQFWSSCPVDVLWQDGVRSKVKTIPGACFPFTPPDRDPLRNSTVTHYDSAAQAIVVETLRDGVPIQECTVSVNVNG